MRCAAVLLLGILSAVRPSLPSANGHMAGFAWRRGTEAVALWKDARIVWQFNYSPALTKPCFHPLALPGGPGLTWLSPKDHPHHLALFFSWKYLNRVNYWEEPAGVPDGRTTWTNVKVETRPDFSAKITLDLHYRPKSATVDVLTERRALAVSTPAEDGAYVIDWDMDFTSGNEDVVLDRTPPDTTPDGNARGGYAGLSIRLARELGDAQVAATEPVGALVKERYGFAASAAEFSGVIGDKAAGVAFFDHPANPRFPTRWYAIADRSVPFWYLNASLLQAGSFTLPASKDLRLRYRVAVHPGRWDGSRLEKEHDRYLRDPSLPLRGDSSKAVL